jgi:hypothetical protein
LVRKHHDGLAESSRKQWFKDFFIKKSTSLGQKSASSSARPVPRTVDKAQKPHSTTTPSLSKATTQTLRINHPTFKLIKVKGCTRLFKYSRKPVPRISSHTSTNLQKHSGHNWNKVIPKRTNGITHTDNKTSTNDNKTSTNGNNDILLHPSGLKMQSLLHKKSLKLTRKVHPAKAAKTQTNDKKSGRRNKGKVETKYPLQGCLEAYGFKMRLPRKNNLVLQSIVEAEVESNEYSGTFISTVP